MIRDFRWKPGSHVWRMLFACERMRELEPRGGWAVTSGVRAAARALPWGAPNV